MRKYAYFYSWGRRAAQLTKEGMRAVQLITQKLKLRPIESTSKQRVVCFKPGLQLNRMIYAATSIYISYSENRIHSMDGMNINKDNLWAYVALLYCWSCFNQLLSRIFGVIFNFTQAHKLPTSFGFCSVKYGRNTFRRITTKSFRSSQLGAYSNTYKTSHLRAWTNFKPAVCRTEI